MQPRTRRAIVRRLSDFERLVEVGVGERTDVGAALVEEGADVTATDVHPREVPAGVRFERDDVTDPEVALYRDADAVYALNLPPELHRPVLDVAREVEAAFLFTTLGADQPAIPVSRETIPGDTVFVARE